MTTQITMASPLGPLALVSDGTALTEVHFDDTGTAEDPDSVQDPILAAARAQLEEYLAGRRLGFDLPLRPGGTQFQRAVWEALPAIPYGRTLTYGTLAARLGHPAAARAVGLANARNPLAVVVPCHRVVGAGGALVGYAGGLQRQRFLLELETQVAGATR
jgi:methylated-DNA-[protein]-cysteine S-methyltransferase